MGKNEIAKVLHQHDNILKKYNIKSVSLFGSYARNEQKKNSDIDFIVDYNEPISLFEHVKLKNELEFIFKKRIDIVTRKALKPLIRSKILKEAIAL